MTERELSNLLAERTTELAMRDFELSQRDSELAVRDAELAKLRRQVSHLQARVERGKAVSASLAAVSATRSAEKERQEQYMSLLLDNSPDIVVLLDRSERIAYCTKVFLEVTGVEDMHRVNRLTFETVLKRYLGIEFAQTITEALSIAKEKGETHECECEMLTETGVRIYSVRITPLKTFVGEVVMMHDITEIRRAQAEAEEARVAAEEASLAKSTFLSNMSHEMRTPMNAIIGMTAIGRGAGELERKDYCFGKIEDASTHLLGVINDILDISKIEAQKFELSPTEFEFERMLRRAVNVVSFRVEEKNQNFDVRIDERIPRMLVGDDQRLTQVIANLLSNAVKFTGEGGSIKLHTELLSRAGDECAVKLLVTDSGIGISQEQIDKLFRSFEQADSGISRKFGGTGLGLAISKSIVEMMGGTINVESTPGIGSTFSVTVNLGVAAGEEGRRSSLAPGVNLENLRVLVVDDSPDLLDYFLDIAHRLGFECDAAIGGREALSLIDMRGGYDLYFVDWKMPSMDGIELSRRISARETGQSVIIMISGVEWSVIKDDATTVGVGKFMSKPLFPSAIAELINDCLGIRDEELAPEAPKEDEGAFRGRRVLFAEDVDINREILVALMEPTELEFDCAVNGLDAVEQFTAAPERYDLVLMDMQMPEMDGCEATRQIRALDNTWARNVPIIAMTANVFREDVEKCLSAGMNDHIGKPLDFAQVLDMMTKYFSFSTSQRHLINSREL